MTQRIGLNEVFAQVRSAMARNYSGLFRSQTRLSTGVNIQAPSDDPVGARRILQIGGQQAAIERHLASVDSARAFLDTGAASLQEVSTLLARARELVVQGSNGTLTAADRDSVADELDGILRSIVQSANVRFEGRHLLAGTAVGTPPFELLTGADGLTRVDYRGNDQEQGVEVGPGILAAVNIPGNRAFAPGARGATAFRGATGAVPGAGTDSGTGRDLLRVAHTQTLFGATPTATGQDPVTGLRAGASSPSGDTVLGLSHGLVVTTDALGNGTLSLDGGPSVAFAAGATDVRVDGPNGERVYVDVSNVAGGLAGVAVALDGRGTLSTDGGASSVAIDFTAAAQQVADSETGAVLHVDARAIRLAGTEEVTYTGAFDLFSTLIGARDLLRDPARTAAEIGDGLRERLADLDRGAATLGSAIGALGTRSAQLDVSESRLEDLDVTLSRLKSQIQDVDVADVMVEMREQEALYQSSLIMASRVSQLSLLNYL